MLLKIQELANTNEWFINENIEKIQRTSSLFNWFTEKIVK